MTSVRAKAIEEMRKKALVRHTDMSQEMSSDAQDVVVMALDKYMEAENWEAASKLIKDTLDKKLGPPWHVMVGKGELLPPLLLPPSLSHLCGYGAQSTTRLILTPVSLAITCHRRPLPPCSRLQEWVSIAHISSISSNSRTTIRARH